MSDSFLGEIKAVGFDYAPVNWAKCNGEFMSVSQNPALFALLGSRYGGDGLTNFRLPDLRGRTVVGEGQGQGLTPKYLGSMGGHESMTLSTANMPAHSHQADITVTNASGSIQTSTIGATSQSPEDNVLARSQTSDPSRPQPIYTYIDMSEADSQMPVNVNVEIDGQIGSTGGGQSFPLNPPYLVLNYIICTSGIFPPRS